MNGENAFEGPSGAVGTKRQNSLLPLLSMHSCLHPLRWGAGAALNMQLQEALIELTSAK